MPSGKQGEKDKKKCDILLNYLHADSTRKSFLLMLKGGATSVGGGNKICHRCLSQGIYDSSVPFVCILFRACSPDADQTVPFMNTSELNPEVTGEHQSIPD